MLKKSNKSKQNVEEFIAVKDIKNNRVYHKDGGLLAYIYLHPNDIGLKKDSEKQLAVKSYSNIYKTLLKGTIQTISIASSTNISAVVEHLEQLKNQENNLIKRKLIHEEIQFIIKKSQETVERNTYLVLKAKTEDELKTKLEQLISQLHTAGLEFKVLNDNEIKYLFFAFFNQDYKGKVKEFSGI